MSLESLTFNERPFWISPRQVSVIPVAAPYVGLFFRLTATKRLIDFILQKEYATQIAEQLQAQGIFVDVDNGDNTLQKKVRNAEVARYNFIMSRLSAFDSLNCCLSCIHQSLVRMS